MCKYVKSGILRFGTFLQKQKFREGNMAKVARGLVPKSKSDVQQSNQPEVSFWGRIKGNGSVRVIISKRDKNSFKISFGGEHLNPIYAVVNKTITREALEKSLNSCVIEVSSRIRITSLDFIAIKRILA